jgi:hypothetical protein
VILDRIPEPFVRNERRLTDERSFLVHEVHNFDLEVGDVREHSLAEGPEAHQRGCECDRASPGQHVLPTPSPARFAPGSESPGVR